MKKIIILLNLFLISLSVLAGGGCDGEIIRITNPGSPIEYWGTNYQSCEYYEWSIMAPDDWSYIEIDYVIDLNPTGAIDALFIYATDTTGQEREVLNYSYQPMVGRITLPLYTPGIRIVFVSEYGNEGGLYKGLKLNYRKGSANPSDQVFFSNVGIGTYPKEKLHVNGAIRGGGANGEVTLKGDNGSVTIGATNATAMAFNTDKNIFSFNKPIQGSGVNGAVKILSSIGGYLELCPMDSGYVRFKTNTSGYYFDKTITLSTGHLISPRKLSFSTNTTNPCMTILTSGNVGIGTLAPKYKLDVNGTIRAKEIIVSTTGADFVFADDYQLRPLSEVKAFIQENKHLPEIQSAQEMQKDGISMSELQIKLLQKIEELTLYILQQQETIQELRQEIEQLKK